MDKDREAFLKWKTSRSGALPNTTDFDAWVAATAAERARCLYWCELGDREGYALSHIKDGTPAGGQWQ